ncbi:hypothetical protein PoB_001753400 [Plakobranchus ocellatus]|uniref:Uncharacterized protein n=1 Tax=Plakobranchus ocellatus TaxID=259542 RepID=A0AAV3ZAR5_9GAST|nr:hypothetical protein PoB_001753400 [Plakobranchus ocellatus]
MFFFYIVSPQQGDLRLSGPPSDQGAGGGARTLDRKVPADLASHCATNAPFLAILMQRMYKWSVATKKEGKDSRKAYSLTFFLMGQSKLTTPHRVKTITNHSALTPALFNVFGGRDEERECLHRIKICGNARCFNEK